MRDLISRQSAIDEIMKCRFVVNAIEKIRGLPSTEPEIIRCKDCKYKYLDGMIWNCPFGLPGGEDFFCAYGAKGGDKE